MRSSYFRMTSAEPSVLAPSMTKYSWMSWRWEMTERIVWSRNLAWLKLGVMMVILGGNLARQELHAHRRRALDRLAYGLQSDGVMVDPVDRKRAGILVGGD